MRCAGGIQWQEAGNFRFRSFFELEGNFEGEMVSR